jgi:hypothetical protein
MFPCSLPSWPVQLSAAIAAATEKASKHAPAPSAQGSEGEPPAVSSAAELRFLSPFNTRVGTSHGVPAGGRADAGAPPAGDDSSMQGDQQDEEEGGLLPGGGAVGSSAAADADDDAEVMDRTKLKKMSEKMLRFRAKMSTQLPGMLGGQHLSGGSAGGVASGGAGAGAKSAVTPGRR